MQTFTLRRGLLSGLFLIAGLLPAAAQRVLWADASPAVVPKQHTLALSRFRAVTVQLGTVRNTLRAAPTERSAAARASGTVVSLPLPDGTSQRFRVVATQVMAPALAARYPRIRTYLAQGLDDPTATARLDVSPAGFHAQILAANRTVYIDPAAPGDTVNHLVFDQSSMSRSALGAVCHTPDGLDRTTTAALNRPAALQRPNGSQLRTYRLAVACTSEYAATKGGTKEGALAGIVTSVNRVDGIYERELAIRMVLIANNDRLIFLTDSTDRYTNDNGEMMLKQNQAVLTDSIGSANYDIGHVFSTGGGGIAALGSVCVAGSKAMGVTGSPNPVGDAFDVDFVAHEMGHQFGADHTFNSQTGSCGRGNRSASSAYEPGSGVTIMAYAGICGNDNLQANSIPYFHSRSYDQILNHVTGAGNCAVVTATGNQAPTVNAGANYRIPIGTPFTLTGSATDPDGDALTYTWEQYNLGPVGAPTAPQGNAPIFRSFEPTPIPSRTFPRVSDLVNNATTIGELLPTYARRLIFRFVARDNRDGGGGVEYDSMNVAVIGTAGPFLVTTPNTATTWQAGVPQQVTWDVANTTQAPINATNVDILLSTDGGLTFPTMLLAATPNDGCESVTVPAATNTALARIKVQATGNVFFDISNQNFTIKPLTAPTFYLNTACIGSNLLTVCPGTSVPVSLSIGQAQGFAGTVALGATGLPNGLSVSYAPASVAAGGTAVATIAAAAATTPGTYTLTLTGTSGGVVQNQVVRVVVPPLATQAAVAVAPAANALVTTRPVFTWQAVPNATAYTVQVATDAAFSNVVLTQTIASDTVKTFTPTAPLAAGTTYYWRVRGGNVCGAAPYSAATAFRTGVVSCQPYAATQIPVTIPATANASASSTIEVSSTDVVAAIRINNLTITHPNAGELTVTLTNPAGRSAMLLATLCAGTANLNLSLDEQATATLACPLNAGGTYRPANSLAGLLNAPANGTWTLRITDNTAGNGGTLTGWALELCTVPAPPAAPTNLLAYLNGTSGSTATIGLQWQNNATNETGFELERSLTTNTSFQRIATIAANQTTYSDEVSSTGRYVYRIRAVNDIGNSAYSNEAVASVTLASATAPVLKGLTVYPNPSSGQFQLELNNAQTGAVQVQVFDALGRSVMTRTFSKASNTLQQTLDLSTVSTGIYQLRVTQPQGISVVKLVKE
ncbi:reprolysin-like metallopeptidase [Hymenobacter defluvii]|uniref:T9SS type A sorting domain-containing protein n=1 Tax=Hymenobacter defluvii TaxID=2054411 RepID=A0ABS3TIG2_9BACT|nr:zinc-dependent metalloprotease family protein [Hymenobacter defluvii]MBO3273173.1 T9SS type A sorting domain-containing protein [Hymenobacter defluvii]